MFNGGDGRNNTYNICITLQTETEITNLWTDSQTCRQTNELGLDD